ncbi:MAG: DEAD/DEAH box helicase family protein [Planctomycetota bacterium]
MPTAPVLTNARSRALMDRFRADPLFFCERALGVRPWEKQREVLLALRDHERVAVRSGHGTGKSFIAASAALWFLYSHYPAKVITTAPTWAQVRAILWNEIRAQHAAALLPLGGTVLEERLKLTASAFAVGLSTDEPERFQGYHAEHLLVILDEAPGVRPEVWEASETLLTGRCSRTLAIGNPTRTSGRFYECFAPESGWKKIRISCLDSPNLDGASRRYPALVTRAWIDQKRADWGERSPFFQARVLGEFPEDGEGALLSRKALEAAARRPMPPCDRASLALGVDVARMGSDATVLLLRDRGGVRHIEAHHEWSTMRTAGRVAELVRRHGLDSHAVFVDDTGLGAGVTDRLREAGLEVGAVVLGGRARDEEHFANVRAECYWRLREALSPPGEGPGLSLPQDAALLRELGAVRYMLTAAGSIRLEEKAAIARRAGGSPDRADALALTFASRDRFDPEITVL